MLNKRGRIIAIAGGAFFLVIILMQNMDKEAMSKDSFYETFSSNDGSINVSKKDKKTASLKLDEEKIKESSESYQQINRNKKDKSFSLYREILESEKEEVEETVVEAEVEEVVEEEPIKEEPKVIVKYIERPSQNQVAKSEPVKEKEEPVEEKRTFRRLTANTGKTSAAAGSGNSEVSSADIYIDAEIYRATTVDMGFPNMIDIRVLNETETVLPNGKKVYPGMMLKGIPEDGSKILKITIPEYGLTVYEEKGFEGIPLTQADGIKEEGTRQVNQQRSTRITVPVVGSVTLTNGRKRESRKVYLNESRTIYLKWENQQ